MLLVASLALMGRGSELWLPDAQVADAASGGANGLTINKTADSDPLVGGLTVYTLTVFNGSFPAGPNNPDGKAYNLNLTDVLPPA